MFQVCLMELTQLKFFLKAFSLTTFIKRDLCLQVYKLLMREVNKTKISNRFGLLFQESVIYIHYVDTVYRWSIHTLTLSSNL